MTVFARYAKAVQAFIGAAVPLCGVVAAQLALSGTARADVTWVGGALAAVGAALVPILGPANAPQTAQGSAALNAVKADYDAAVATISAFQSFFTSVTTQPTSGAPATVVTDPPAPTPTA